MDILTIGAMHRITSTHQPYPQNSIIKAGRGGRERESESEKASEREREREREGASGNDGTKKTDERTNEKTEEYEDTATEGIKGKGLWKEGRKEGMDGRKAWKDRRKEGE